MPEWKRDPKVSVFNSIFDFLKFDANQNDPENRLTRVITNQELSKIIQAHDDTTRRNLQLLLEEGAIECIVTSREPVRPRSDVYLERKQYKIVADSVRSFEALNKEGRKNWTPAELESIRTLFAEGKTVSEIGTILGVSKDKITGKIAALRLPKRDGSERKPRHHTQTNVGAANFRKSVQYYGNVTKEEVKAFRAPKPPTVKQTKKLIVGYSRTCQFPLWADFAPPTHEYCGNPSTANTSWCSHHLRIVAPKIETT